MNSAADVATFVTLWSSLSEDECFFFSFFFVDDDDNREPDTESFRWDDEFFSLHSLLDKVAAEASAVADSALAAEDILLPSVAELLPTVEVKSI